MGIKSSKLSPQARKAIIRAKDIGPVKATVELAPGFSPDNLGVTPEQLQAEILGWSEHSRIMSISIDPERLTDLAEIAGITYIQVGGGMRNPRAATKDDPL